MATARTYQVNEVFYSIQGEGMRAGTANVFVRFTGCNMQCDLEPGPKSPGGFACDTEFASGVKMTAEEIEAAAYEHWPIAPIVAKERRWIVFTGGEPALQVDAELCEFLRGRGWSLAIETNGSIELPRSQKHAPPWSGPDGFDRMVREDPAAALACYLVDWITVSPKVAEHAVRQVVAHEVKYVRGAGQGIPRPSCWALHKLLSPAFNGLAPDRLAIATCVELVKAHPEWRMCVQHHKGWQIR